MATVRSTNIARTWSFITIDDEKRQYGGNEGYDDYLSGRYLYDSAVANHVQVAAGDLVLVRGHDRLLGIARIAMVTVASVLKQRNRCPVCKNGSIKRRKLTALPWRCKQGHQFHIPLTDTVSVTGYTAHYGSSFVPSLDGVPVSALRNAALRPNDQNSIQELDLGKVEMALAAAYPATRSIIARFLDALALDPGDAVYDPGNEVAGDEEMSMTDARKAILRSIRLRRGQRKFRNLLLAATRGRCQVTGCRITDILEAAHVDSYRNDTHNQVTNGLLLRADVHTLFDLNLMAVEPTTLTMHFHPAVVADGYSKYDGQPLNTGAALPSQAALRRRWEVFAERLERP